MNKHYELGYARRPENMVMWNSRENKLGWEWFSLTDYDDEAQSRMDEYGRLIKKVEGVYNPFQLKRRMLFLRWLFIMSKVLPFKISKC